VVRKRPEAEEKTGPSFSRGCPALVPTVPGRSMLFR
jgi:hypothetical protein